MNEIGCLSPKRTILLTGAGFSKPYGGLLADEMWAAILTQPEVRDIPSLRELVLSDQNYESLYERVLGEDAYTELRSAFTRALRRAYGRMDQAQVQGQTRSGMMCQSFVRLFAGDVGTDRGFFFTLNQDLLVERHYGGDPLLKAPALTGPDWSSTCEFVMPEGERREELPTDETLKIRRKAYLENKGERFAYVKLHGSLAWRKANDEDVLVIGNAKSAQIQSEPLLSWYFSLFEAVLSEPERNLVVVGYSFRDPHINEAIARAIKYCGLRLYVVSREAPESFHERLLTVYDYDPSDPFHEDYRPGCPRGEELWGGLYGYHFGSIDDFASAGAGKVTPAAEAFLKQVGLH